MLLKINKRTQLQNSNVRICLNSNCVSESKMPSLLSVHKEISFFFKIKLQEKGEGIRTTPNYPEFILCFCDTTIVRKRRRSAVGDYASLKRKLN